MAVFYLLESFVMRTRLKLISEIVLIIQMKETDIFLTHLHILELLYSAFLKPYLNNHITSHKVSRYFVLACWKLYLVK